MIFFTQSRVGWVWVLWRWRTTATKSEFTLTNGIQSSLFLWSFNMANVRITKLYVSWKVVASPNSLIWFCKLQLKICSAQPFPVVTALCLGGIFLMTSHQSTKHPVDDLRNISTHWGRTMLLQSLIIPKVMPKYLHMKRHKTKHIFFETLWWYCFNMPKKNLLLTTSFRHISNQTMWDLIQKRNQTRKCAFPVQLICTSTANLSCN